jgi:hypothetical protein
MAEDIIGLFIGLKSSSYEYLADIIAPYRTDFSLEIGSILIIDSGSEKIVARVTEYAPEGELTSFMGLKWLGDVAFEENAIGQEIKSKKVRYRVIIKILGNLEKNGTFVAGVHKIPHITSKVVRPDTKLVKSIINQVLKDEENGIDIGTYTLDGEIKVKFDMSQLNSKRTFIFARAGFGKSNLMKIIAKEWKEKYGGLLIFDPEGEYATTADDRPGIMDCREALLITNRPLPSKVKNVYKNLKFDLASMNPKFIIPILVPDEKHGDIFFQKLMTMNQEKWTKLVKLFKDKEYNAEDSEIKELVSGTLDTQSVAPIRNNLIPPIKNINDSESDLLEIVEIALKEGKVVIIDISLIDSRSAQQLSSAVIKHIFDKNQRNFTSATEDKKNLIKATFVVEEAQTVLGEKSNVTPFIELAKEGRKYKLGGIFITQQPRSIPFEILSQADNFFVFHLLSKGDLIALQDANAHYSIDIMSQILSEPAKGKGYMWTSSQPFVIPVKILNFEELVNKNNAEEIQNKSTLLENIIKKLSGEQEEITSLFSKADSIESDTPLDKGNPKKLFEKLTQKEKELLEEKGYLLKNKDTGQAWTITYHGYDVIKAKKTKALAIGA